MLTLDKLRSLLQNAKGDDTQFTARCPAHEDQQNSLSVKMSDDGKILLNCFTGCSTENIVAKLGHTMTELFPPQAGLKKQKISECAYEYCDEIGALLYRKHRVDYSDGTKTFFFKQPNGTKGVKGVRRVPYRLSEVVAAQTVYFVEGEKCADAIAETGRAATTLDSGAKSKWLPDYAKYFKGKAVVILPDNDSPGMEYAKQIHKQLPNSRIVQLPALADKEDVYDWLKAWHTMDEVDALLALEEPPPADENAEKDAFYPKLGTVPIQCTICEA